MTGAPDSSSRNVKADVNTNVNVEVNAVVNKNEIGNETGNPIGNTIDELLQQGVDTVYPAAAVHCLLGRQVFYARSVGTASAETCFDIASLTKALCTSVLCLRAIAQGSLRLDEAPLPGVSVEALLRHESGLPAWLPLFAPGLTDASEAAARPFPSPSDTLRRAAFAAARSAPRQPAGQRAVYSDLGFIVLADLLEGRLNQRLDDAFARLADALGLELAFRPLDVAEPAQRLPATRCAPTRRESPTREILLGLVHDDNARAMLGVSGHAGLFGTAAAVAQLAGALLDCYHGCDTSAARVLGIPAPLLQAAWAQPDLRPEAGHAPGTTWGLGWDHPSPHGAASTAPSSSASLAAVSSAGTLWPRTGVGHLGFTGCSLWIDPAHDRDHALVAVFLSNRACVATPQAAAATQAGIKRLRPALHDAIQRALQT